MTPLATLERYSKEHTSERDRQNQAIANLFPNRDMRVNKDGTVYLGVGDYSADDLRNILSVIAS